VNLLISVLLVSWLQSTGGSVPGVPAATKGDLTIADEKLRRELEVNYAKIVSGFKKDDPSVWEGFLTPDFQLKLFNGEVKDRKWVSGYVRNNAKAFKILRLSMEIKAVSIDGNDVAATVEQKSSRTFVDKERNTHRLDVGAVQHEVWTKTTAGLRLKFAQEKELLYLQQDGKPKRS
jgi:hypothetical protein